MKALAEAVGDLIGKPRLPEADLHPKVHAALLSLADTMYKAGLVSSSHEAFRLAVTIIAQMRSDGALK